MKTSEPYKAAALGLVTAVILSTLPACASNYASRQGHDTYAQNNYRDVSDPRSRDGRVFPARDGSNGQEIEGRSGVGGATGPENRVLTGSNVPRKYNRRGYNTDSADNVEVIDQNDVRFRSRNTPSEILATDPSISINRH